MSKSSDRLADLLEEAEERATAAEEELERLKEQFEDGRHTWAQPRKWEANGLPVPRLELHWRRVTDYEQECVYVMVRKHFLDDIVGTPLGHTRSSGGRSTRGFMSGDFIDTPFRDGAHAKHDSAQLGLPLYVTTCDGDVDQITGKTPRIIKRGGK